MIEAKRLPFDRYVVSLSFGLEPFEVRCPSGTKDPKPPQVDFSLPNVKFENSMKKQIYPSCDLINHNYAKLYACEVMRDEMLEYDVQPGSARLRCSNALEDYKTPVTYSFIMYRYEQSYLL